MRAVSVSLQMIPLGLLAMDLSANALGYRMTVEYELHALHSRSA